MGVGVAPGLRTVAEQRGYTGLRPLGTGLEFVVYEAVTADGDRVVLRTSVGNRFQSNANDPTVDTRALLAWEHAVTGHVARFGIPVATPRELVLGDRDVLVNGYVPDDGGGADQRALGALLRRLHSVPVPAAVPVNSEGLPTAALLPRRIGRRWAELAATVGPDLPPAPDPARLAATLADGGAYALVHLDVRTANLRCVGGQVRGLLDWSNALVADPVLELGRLAEFALLPDNGVDLPELLAGYGAAEPDTAAYWCYRLDAAVMLAVVFTSEAPDPHLGPAAVARLVEVRERLLREWGR